MDKEIQKKLLQQVRDESREGMIVRVTDPDYVRESKWLLDQKYVDGSYSKTTTSYYSRLTQITSEGLSYLEKIEGGFGFELKEKWNEKRVDWVFGGITFIGGLFVRSLYDWIF